MYNNRSIIKIIAKVRGIENPFIIPIGFSIALAILVQFLLYEGGLYSISADESSRTRIAYDFSRNNHLAVGNWLPFHTLLLGALFKIWPNLFLAPRLLSHAFGILVLVSVIILTHCIFRNKRATILSGFLAALLPQRVILATVPLSEIFLISSICLGFIFLNLWVERSEFKYLVALGVCMSLATMTRYEGWAFATGLILYFLLLKHRYSRLPGLRQRLVLLVLVSAFPILWLTLQFYTTGNPLAFTERAVTSENSALVWKNLTFLPILKETLQMNVLYHFIQQNMASLNGLAFISIFLTLNKNQRTHATLSIAGWALLIMSIVWFLVLSIPGSTFRLIPSNAWRFASVWSVLLIPFTAHAMVLIEDACKHKRRLVNFLFRMILYAIVTIFFVQQIDQLAKESSFSGDERSLGMVLKKRLAEEPSARVLIDSPDWAYLDISIASNYPDRFIANTGINPRQPTTAILQIDNAGKSVISDADPFTFYVFRSEKYKRWLSSQPHLHPIAEIGKWRVFEFRREFFGVGPGQLFDK